MAGAARYGFEVVTLETAASTNTLALDSGADGRVYVALAQSGGRGRLGAVWHSAPGLGLWMSVALRLPPADLGPAACLAVRDAVAHLGFRPPLTVKWPNDLLAGGRKVCGVLVEHRAGQTALGIGLNRAHATDDFPADVLETASSLLLAYGRAPGHDALLDAVLAALCPRLEAIRGGRGDVVFAEWRAALALEGRTVARGAVCGVVEAVARDGALCVRTETGLARVDAGVIEILEGRP